MLRIALSTLAARKGGMLGAFAAVSLAVVLVVSCGILLDSSLRAPIPVERLAAAGVVVQAHTTFSGGGSVGISLPERVRLPVTTRRRECETVPACKQAIADRSFDARSSATRRTVVTGPGGLPPSATAGRALRSTPFALTRGRAPRSPAEIVLDGRLSPRTRSISLGRPLQIATATARGQLHGRRHRAAPSDRRLPAREAPVFFRDDVAARLSGERRPGRPDRRRPRARRRPEAPSPTRSPEHLERPGLRVLTGAKRGEAESPDGRSQPRGHRGGADGVRPARSVRRHLRRRQHVRALRPAAPPRARALPRDRQHAAAGAPHGRRRGAAGRDRGAVVAAPIASLAARLEQGLFTRAGMLPEGLHIVVGWLPFVAGLGIAIVTTQLAAFASARRASRIRPTDALREAACSDARSRCFEGSPDWPASPADSPSSPHPAAAAKAARPRPRWSGCSPSPFSGRSWRWPFAWLIGLPLASAQPRARACSRARTRARISGASPPSRRR